MHADLEQLVIAAAIVAWRNLIERDRSRGGDGKLRDTAISLTPNPMMLTIHCDFSDDARTLSVGFVLPEPLPPPELENVNDEFLLDLHEWLEGRQPAPELFTREEASGTTLH